jgi:hypothetical protein
VEDDADRHLCDSEALLDRAGRLAGVGGWSLDLAGRTITWNAQACRLHDVPAGHRPSLDEALGYAADPGQHQVDDVEVLVEGFRLSQEARPFGEFAHVHALLAQVLGEGLAALLIVVDQGE